MYFLNALRQLIGDSGKQSEVTFMSLIDVVKQNANGRTVAVWGIDNIQIKLYYILKYNCINVMFVSDKSSLKPSIRGEKVLNAKILNKDKFFVISMNTTCTDRLKTLGFEETTDYIYKTGEFLEYDYAYDGVFVGKYTTGILAFANCLGRHAQHDVIESIGRYCAFNGKAYMNGDHAASGLSICQRFTRDIDSVITNKITIGHDVRIGANVFINASKVKSIGNGAIIGANCVVNEDVPPYAIFVGVPGKVKKYRFTPEQIEILERVKWWDWDDETIKQNSDCFRDINIFFERFKDGNILTKKRREVKYPCYPILSKQEKIKFDSAVKLLFTGDLILLEDAVKNAYNGIEYDFSSAFEYTSKYISAANLSVGVFEGPCAGEDAGYSTSNYGDNIPLAINFPDSFAKAVKEAGFDFVTTANNHLIDRGIKGALRTLDVLDSVGLEHIGSYRSQDEKEKVKIIEVEGLRFAFLAYTFGVNKGKVSALRNSKHSFLTSFLVSPANELFNTVKTEIFEDFARVKKENPDIIIVLPHMGSMFSHNSNDYQEAWYKVFIEAGADVIVGDHSHAVQPIEFRGDVLIVNDVGNYVNSYVSHDGDASAMVEVYFDKASKKCFGTSVIPLYGQTQLGKTPRALPVYDIMTNPRLKEQISVLEFNRVKEAHDIVTEVMLEHKLSVDMIAPRYYKTKDKFIQDTIFPCNVSKEELKKSAIMQLLINSSSVCFVGDSITHGSLNGGVGWYEPMLAYLDNITHTKMAYPSAVVLTLLNRINRIADVGAEFYVVAIGTNDVIYRNPDICAMTPEEYTGRINELFKRIKQKNSTAKFAFIAPWIALANDKQNKCTSIAERDVLLEKYGDVLEVFCEKEGCLYLNPNPYIKNVLSLEPASKYLVDCYIHPGRLNGVSLYSKAVILAK